MDSRKFLDSSAARGSRGMATVDIDLSAAVSDRVLNYPGTLLYVDKASTGICSVEGSVDQGTLTSPLLASPGFSMCNEAGFSGFRLSWAAQPNKIMRLVIASGMQIKPGDPVASGAIATQTLDAGLARTLNNQAFFGTANNNAPVGGQNPNVALWNPVGSGKSVIVESFSFSSSTAQVIVIGDASTQLANAMAAGSVASKYSNGGIGASAGVAQVRYTNQVGAPILNSVFQFQVQANVPIVQSFREPMVLPSGRGLLLYGVTVNTYLQANFEWFEQ